MPQNSRPTLIGVTGNIGSGKSSFCKVFAEHGLSVYSADLIAKQQLADPIVIKALVHCLGSQILEEGVIEPHQAQKISPAKLAKIVFNSPRDLAFLNAVVHPMVLQAMDKIVATSREQLIIFEVPLLFEANLQNCFDYIILVHSSQAIRNARINATREPGDNKRAEFQISDEFKIKSVDLVINNDDTLLELQRQALAVGASLNTILQKSIRFFSSNKLR